MKDLEVLNKIVDGLLEDEGITKEDLELVDLDIEYSPVIAIRGENFCDAVEAITCTGGQKYLVKHPLVPEAVDAETLKIMRYRYLTSRPKMKNPTLIARGTIL